MTAVAQFLVSGDLTQTGEEGEGKEREGERGGKGRGEGGWRVDMRGNEDENHRHSVELAYRTLTATWCERKSGRVHTRAKGESQG